jgi:RNA polymerase sigma factor (sigma-70 family)
VPGPEDEPLPWADRDFKAFYEQSYGIVTGWLRRRGARRDETDDCAQVAMLCTWQRWAEFTSEDGARAFACVVARNEFISKRRYDTRNHPLGYLDELSVETAESPGASAERGEARRALRRALARLTDEERALFTDAEVHRLSTYELAERYGSSPNTIRQRTYRIRRRLEAHLAHLRVPAIVPPLRTRRPARPARSAARWLHELDARLPAPYGQTISVIVTALTLVAAPFGALGPLPAATARPSATPGTAAPPSTASRAARPELAPPPPGAPLEPPGASGTTAPADQARPAPAPAPPPGAPVPPLCIAAACTPGTEPGEPGDVLIVHAPPPAGDTEVRQGMVAVCGTAPDSAAWDCHTDGDPDYRVSPPPPP